MSPSNTISQSEWTQPIKLSDETHTSIPLSDAFNLMASRATENKNINKYNYNVHVLVLEHPIRFVLYTNFVSKDFTTDAIPGTGEIYS